MKVFLRNSFAALLAAAITLGLGTAFWFSSGKQPTISAGAARLDGKVFSFASEPPLRKAATTPEAPPEGNLRVAKSGREKAKRGIRIRKKRIHQRQTNEAALQEPALSTAASAGAPPDLSEPSLAYRLEKLADHFEDDDSKYLLERSIALDGVSLSLLGLERRERMFVLKVAVGNATEADFFIKDITAQAGSSSLGSRALFRILVEPHRTREEYVFFAKPSAGAAVKIALKEDGGKGRSLVAEIPYPF